jgi:hypothetical protein
VRLEELAVVGEGILGVGADLAASKSKKASSSPLAVGSTVVSEGGGSDGGGGAVVSAGGVVGSAGSAVVTCLREEHPIVASIPKRSAARASVAILGVRRIWGPP